MKSMNQKILRFVFSRRHALGIWDMTHIHPFGRFENVVLNDRYTAALETDEQFQEVKT